LHQFMLTYILLLEASNYSLPACYYFSFAKPCFAKA
jgi:hypothetical protein